ncbi:MAG: AraC family transcriptional regulator [Akkermansiaceae bacterium]|nr:AraC family transcriptional regulator [Akkermansiaceae bacterium]
MISTLSISPRATATKRPVVSLTLEPYHREIHLGVVRAAKELGWDLDDSRCHYGNQRSLPSEESPDGVITTSLSPAMSEWIQDCACPAVSVNTGDTSQGSRQPASIPVVELDFAKAGAMAAKHLCTLGYPSLAYLHASRGKEAEAQLRAFAETCRTAGKSFQVLDFTREFHGVSETTGGIPRHHWINWLSDKVSSLIFPCAIMAQDDREALEIMSVAEDLGLRVPEDLAVLGCLDLEVVHGKSQVPLSSIDMNFELAGYTAARLLDQAMRSVPTMPNRVMVPPKRLIERRSTFSFACDIPAVAKTLMRIRRDYAEKLTVPTLAKEAGMSVRTLQRVYGSVTGSSISDDLLKRRLEVASSLLRETSLKLESIARAVGLGSANHLCHLFKERYGQTPRQWREHDQELHEQQQPQPKDKPRLPVSAA